MNETEEPKAKKRPNFFVRLLLLLVTFALVAGAVVLVVYHDQLNLDAVKRYFTYRKITANESGQAELITHPGGSKIHFAALGDGYLMCSDTGIRLYTSGGKQLSERLVSMDDPVLTSGGGLAAVYDAGGSSLFLYDKTEEILDLELENAHSILSARLNPSGYLALTAESSGYKGTVTIYGPDQEKRMALNYSSAFVMDAAVSSGNDKAAIITIGQADSSFESRLLIYSLNETEASVNVSLGNTVVLDLEYEPQAVWAVGESSLSVAAPNSGEVQSYSYNSRYLKDFSLGGDGYAALLLGRYRAGTAAELVSVDAAGQELGSIPMNDQVLSLSAAGRYIAVLTSDRLDIYTKDLTLYSSLTDTQNARSVVMQEDGSAILVGSSSARIYLPG